MHYAFYFASGKDMKWIKSFFESIDSDFVPPVSQLPGGLERYLAQPLREGTLGLCETETKIIAASAYYRKDNSIFVGITGVARDHRSSPALYRLLRFMALREAKRGYDTVKVRTWPANDSIKKILKKFQFTKTRDIIDPRYNGCVFEEYTTVQRAIRDYFMKHDFDR